MNTNNLDFTGKSLGINGTPKAAATGWRSAIAARPHLASEVSIGPDGTVQSAWSAMQIWRAKSELIYADVIASRDAAASGNLILTQIDQLTESFGPALAETLPFWSDFTDLNRFKAWRRSKVADATAADPKIRKCVNAQILKFARAVGLPIVEEDMAYARNSSRLEPGSVPMETFK